MEAPRRQVRGHLERVRREDVHALVEEAVAAHAVAAEALHAVGDLERSPAVDARRFHPRRLARRVVRHLVLEEDVGAAVSVPDHLVLLEMLDEEPIGGHVVPVDHHAGVGRVDRPPHTVAVVRAPRPDVVEDHIAAVDDERLRRRAGRRSADSEEDVGQDRWVGGVAGIVTGSDLQEHLRGARAGVEYDAGHQVAARVDEPHRRAAVVRDQGREAQAQDHRVGMHDLDRLVEVIDPRGQDQVLAAGERRRDRVRRVARPPDHDVPEVSCWTAGTNTLYPPAESMYR